MKKIKLYAKKIGAYAKNFVKDESGTELLQFAIVVVIAVGLIAAVMYIKNVIDSGLTASGDSVIKGFHDAGVDIPDVGGGANP